MDPIMFNYMIRNLAYDLPVLGKWFFLQDVKKIIPTLKYSDLKYNSGDGGIRPQIVNSETRQLEMGDAQVVGDNVIFNITPSPGASTCLANAYRDAKKIAEFFPGKIIFDDKAWEEDFVVHPEHVELAHK
jgi:malate dehydrogenase (quinone)